MKRRRRYILTLLLCALMASGCNDGAWSSGDRVLVAKFLYDMHLVKPSRFDVVVFRYPERPVENGTPKNYIKRLLGLPGELLAIFFGRIYRAATPVEHPEDQKADPNDLWHKENMHSEMRSPNADEGRAFWQSHRFEIVRKPLDTLLAMRRSVYDNDFPAKDLENVQPPRWAGGRDQLGKQNPTNWVADDQHGFKNDGRGGAVDWLRYQHILRPNPWPIPKGTTPDTRPQLITDFLAYNNFVTNGRPPEPYVAHNWVGDLMLECKVKVEKSGGELTMELSKGVDRFQAIFDLQSGECTLVRLTDKKGQKEKERIVLATKATRLKGPGEYDLRFANIDERLTVWVDRDLPFDDGVAYPPPTERGPMENDLQPASVGSKGAAVEVHRLKLWRDTYYTLQTSQAADSPAQVDWADPKTWQPLRDLDYRTLYVQPGHYLCMGDNSPQSSDSREWGTVPERLMLGRALMVYFPFDRAGRIK